MAVAGDGVKFFANLDGTVRVSVGGKNPEPQPGEVEIGVVEADIHFRADSAMTIDLVVYPDSVFDAIGFVRSVLVVCPECGSPGTLGEWYLAGQGELKRDGMKDSVGDGAQQEGVQ